MVSMPPFTYQETAGDSGPSTYWLILYPLLTMLLIPSLSSQLASEKEEGLMEMISAEGGRVESYFLGNVVFCFVYNVAFNGLFILTIKFSGASDGDSAVHMEAWQIIALLVSWGVSMTGFVIFKGLVVFSKASHAAIFGLLSVLMSTVAAEMITASDPKQPLS